MKRNQPFKAPDGYFKELPSRIQARAADSGRKTTLWELPAIRWAAIPAMLLAIVFYVMLPKANVPPETLLADVPTEELIAYLEASEMSTSEILDLIEAPNSLLDESDTDILGDDLTEEDMDLLLENYDVLL